jgi:hypothetical protein
VEELNMEQQWNNEMMEKENKALPIIAGSTLLTET